VGGVIAGGINILENEPRHVELKKLVYYNSIVNLIKLLSILPLLALGGILIFRSSFEQIIDEDYIKSATVALWVSLIGCGLSYFNFVSNYKKSIEMFGLEDPDQTESIKRIRLFGPTISGYLFIIVSICMLAFGLWFGVLFILLGLLNA